MLRFVKPFFSHKKQTTAAGKPPLKPTAPPEPRGDGAEQPVALRVIYIFTIIGKVTRWFSSSYKFSTTVAGNLTFLPLLPTWQDTAAGHVGARSARRGEMSFVPPPLCSCAHDPRSSPLTAPTLLTPLSLSRRRRRAFLPHCAAAAAASPVPPPPAQRRPGLWRRGPTPPAPARVGQLGGRGEE